MLTSDRSIVIVNIRNFKKCYVSYRSKYVNRKRDIMKGGEEVHVC